MAVRERVRVSVRMTHSPSSFEFSFHFLNLSEHCHSHLAMNSAESALTDFTSLKGIWLQFLQSIMVLSLLATDFGASITEGLTGLEIEQGRAGRKESVSILGNRWCTHLVFR